MELIDSMASTFCDQCGAELQIGQFPFCSGDPAAHVSANPGIVSDGIPGGIWIKHGLCNPDRTPKRYDSITDIRRAANEKGLTMGGDTPKPYKVHWSGKRDAAGSEKR